jgi:hypothetical protein
VVQRGELYRRSAIAGVIEVAMNRGGTSEIAGSGGKSTVNLIQSQHFLGSRRTRRLAELAGVGTSGGGCPPVLAIEVEPLKGVVILRDGSRSSRYTSPNVPPRGGNSDAARNRNGSADQRKCHND